LTGEELFTVASAIVPGAEVSDLRPLIRLGVAQPSRGGELRLHDAFHLLAAAELDHLDNVTLRTLRVRLADVLFASIRGQETLARLLRWMALLPQIGQTKRLTDLATEDFFQEIGVPPELRAAIEKIADSDASPSERFWAMDALAFWAVKAEDDETLNRWVETQQRLAEGGALGPRETIAFHIKRMVVAGQSGDRPEVERRYSTVAPLISSPLELETLAYDYAVAVYYSGGFREAAQLAFELAEVGAKNLGLDPDALDEVAPWSAPEVDNERQGCLKRLADALDLMAKAAGRLGVSLARQRRQAMLLYARAGAMHSAVKLGQDVVEDYLIADDPEGARRLMEAHLLPALQRYDFPDIIIQVRAQYAAVLAFAGAGEHALAELRRLSAYDMTSKGTKDFAGQSALVSDLQAAGWPRPSEWLQLKLAR
jgi:hypothetical protein